MHELVEQGTKYKSALHKCLVSTGEKNPHISIVFVLGQSLHEEDDAALGEQHVRRTLDPLNARAVQYESLIHSARKAYAEYLKGSAEMDRLDRLLAKL